MMKNLNLRKFSFTVNEYKMLDGTSDYQMHMKNERVPEEIVIAHLRGMLRYFERKYFKDFDASLATITKE